MDTRLNRPGSDDGVCTMEGESRRKAHTTKVGRYCLTGVDRSDGEMIENGRAKEARVVEFSGGKVVGGAERTGVNNLNSGVVQPC